MEKETNKNIVEKSESVQNMESRSISHIWIGIAILVYFLAVKFALDVDAVYNGAIDTNLTIWTVLAPCSVIAYLWGIFKVWLGNQDDDILSEKNTEITDNNHSLRSKILLLIANFLVVANMKNVAFFQGVVGILLWIGYELHSSNCEGMKFNQFKCLIIAYIFSFVSTVSYLHITKPITITKAESILHSNYGESWHRFEVIENVDVATNINGYYYFVPKDRTYDFAIAISVDDGEVYELK